MNEHERHLLQQLLHSGQRRGLNRPMLRTACEFVIKHGWWYTPTLTALPAGKPNQCFLNACEMAASNHDYVYVEGYAIIQGGVRTAHAWLTDGQGNAIDITWPEPGVAYAGVPFARDFVVLNLLKHHAAVCLIDDYTHDWPLLREHGDRPAKWRDLRGKGREKIEIAPGEIECTGSVSPPPPD